MSGKLVILAGGISSRMKNSHVFAGKLDSKLLSDTQSKSKSMIGIGDNERPFLDYLLYNAYQADYRDIIIVINQNDASIKNYYRSQKNKNWFREINILYAVQPIPHGREKPLGTADALLYGLRSKSDWNGKTFTVCNNDNLYSQHALRLMLELPYANAMIDYDRNGLGFEKERIEKFAVTKKDDEGFLIDIIEKPTEEEINSVKSKDGCIGVSMNIFKLSYDMIYSILETVPINPKRQEKELPTAVKMMVEKYPKSVYAYPMNEEVPDLTSKDDILKVKLYLEKHFKNIS